MGLIGSCQYLVCRNQMKAQVKTVSSSTDITPNLPLCGPVTLSVLAMVRKCSPPPSAVTSGAQQPTAADPYPGSSLRLHLQPPVSHVYAQHGAAAEVGAKRAVDGEDGRVLGVVQKDPLHHQRNVAQIEAHRRDHQATF